MKSLLIITVLALPLGIFAQGNGNANPQTQIQNVNYYNNINDDINPVETNTAIQQQSDSPAQEQQQGSFGNIFGSGSNNNKPCTDCDEVKAAIKASHASSGGHSKKSISMKKKLRAFSGRMNMKMKKMFAKKYKPKTSYAICFNWH